MKSIEKFDAVFYQETMLSSGVFRRETAAVLSLVEGGENASEQVGGFERVGGSLDVGRVEAKLGLAVERLTLNLRPISFSF